MIQADISQDSPVNISTPRPTSVSLPGTKLEPPKTWRERQRMLMRSNKFQYAIIIMVILDSMIVVVELLVKNAIVKRGRDGQSKLNKLDSNYFMPAGREEPEHVLEDQSHVCHVLRLCGMVIVGIFMVEITVKILVEGMQILEQKAEIFDIMVVLSSFTLDVIFSFDQFQIDATAQDLSGLIILFRLWRVSKIVHGWIATVKLEMQIKLQRETLLRMQVEKQVEKLLIKVKKTKHENERLKAERKDPPSNTDAYPGNYLPAIYTQREAAIKADPPSNTDAYPGNYLQAIYTQREAAIKADPPSTPAPVNGSGVVPSVLASPSPADAAAAAPDPSGAPAS